MCRYNVDKKCLTFMYIHGAFNTFPDFFLYRHSVCFAIHIIRWLTPFYDFSLRRTAKAGIGILPTKAWLSQLVNFKNAIWTWGQFRRAICNKILFQTWKKMLQKRMECFRLLLDHLAWIKHRFLSGIRNSKKSGSLWGMMRGVAGVRKSIN